MWLSLSLARARDSKTALTTRVLQLVHEVLARRIHITKRDLFYTDVRLFRDQRESDPILDDVACMLGCTRSSLNGASERAVAGRRRRTRAADAPRRRWHGHGRGASRGERKGHRRRPAHLSRRRSATRERARAVLAPNRLRSRAERGCAHARDARDVSAGARQAT